MKVSCLALILVVLMVSAVQAGILGVTAGATYPPPTTLGPYDMTPFGPDDRPVGEWVTSVPSPLGGEGVFSASMRHRRLGDPRGGGRPGRSTCPLIITPPSPSRLK